jgi:hypothetical protein
MAAGPDSGVKLRCIDERVSKSGRADDMRGVLLRQGAPAHEALQTLLLDRVDCTPVLVAGTRTYAFTGDGTFGRRAQATAQR